MINTTYFFLGKMNKMKMNKMNSLDAQLFREAALPYTVDTMQNMFFIKHATTTTTTPSFIFNEIKRRKINKTCDMLHFYDTFIICSSVTVFTAVPSGGYPAAALIHTQDNATLKKWAQKCKQINKGLCPRCISFYCFFLFVFLLLSNVSGSDERL